MNDLVATDVGIVGHLRYYPLFGIFVRESIVAVPALI